MSAAKVPFAPLPIRVMLDDLSGLHMRVLACIAYHDRMSLATGKGQGCRASNQTIAGLVGCDYTRLSATISALIAKGYVTREKSSDNRRHTVYRVVYDDADSLQNGKASASATVCDTAKDEPSTVCQTANPDPAIVCQVSENVVADQQDAAPNIFRETGGRYSVETVGRNSVETARLATRGSAKGRQAESVGSVLARFERSFRSDPSSLDLPAWSERLDGVQEAEFDGDDAAYYRAQRLGEEVAEHIDQAAWDRGELDDDGAPGEKLRAPVAAFWRSANRAGKDELARRHGMTVGEIESYVRGGSLLTPKCVALRSTALQLAGNAP